MEAEILLMLEVTMHYRQATAKKSILQHRHSSQFE